MDFFHSLLKTYENAESEGWVDNASKGAILLPIYHDSKKSSNEMIITVTLDEMGEFIKADFLGDDESIVFPVTSKSAIRTSNSAPHPLVDQMKYLTANDEYHNQLRRWIDFTDNSEVRRYLTLIQNFLKTDGFLDYIFNSLYGKNYTRQGLIVSVDNNGKNKKIDFTKCYVEFAIDDFIGKKTVSVTNYLQLHQVYIQFIEAQEQDKIICNISGRKEAALTRHRSAIEKGKLISGGDSVNSENYLGRFTHIEDVIQIGYQTSEKIHLMLKFLSANPNTHINFGTFRLLNWFSDDMANVSQLELLKPKTDENDFFDWFHLSEAINHQTRKKFAADKLTRNRCQAWIHGRKTFSDSSSYYIAIMDNATNGRTALQYFRELQSSELLDHLEDWQDRYSWEINYKGNLFIPSFGELIDTTYGVERSDPKNKKILKVDNDGFKKNQFQMLLTALIDGKDIPSSITKKIEANIAQRHRYPELWYRIERVALAVLHKLNGEEFTPMLDRKNRDRSYLFGRLLALYEIIETTYNRSKENLKEKDSRITNAERYWTAYTSQPATIMTVLDGKLRYCIDYLKIKEKGYWGKIDDEFQEIIQSLTPIMTDKFINQPLDYKFIFGYYAEKKFYYTPKVNTESEE